MPPLKSCVEGISTYQQIKKTFVRPPVHPVSDLDAIIPADPRQTYDPKEIIARITDGSEFREFKSEYGKSLITGFAEIHGHT